ncbi:hypothetical protein GDO78_011970, partial [Eleutherodactylus coqui]
MNNQEVVAVLQECKKMLQVLASEVSEPSEEEKNDYQRCEASLPDDLRSLIQEAKEMKWPFVPERWQYKQAVDPEDKTNLQDLINPRLRNLLAFLKASILVHDSCTAAAIVFLIDRFLYWADASIRLLSVAKVLHKIWPSTPIAPQVVIRQARISVNSGKLLKAEYILSSLISNNGATGTWNYSEESDRLLVQSVCIQIRGQILQKLGMWYEAAELIWTSIVGFFELPIPDKKGLASSLGILADIFISMSEEDYHRFKKSSHVGLTLLEDYEHRLLSAAEACKLAATFSLYTPLFVLTNLNIRGACLLSYSLSKECPTEKRTYYLSQAKESFHIGLLTKKRGDRVISKQELHSFVKAAFCLVNVHKWLNGKQPVNEDVNQLCREAMEKLAKYNMLPDKLDKVNVSIDIMSLVSSIKEHLDVQPFQKTEDNCYVPDSYNDCVKKDLFTRKVRFTELLDMYSQHHNSVCEVFDATCRQHIATDGLKSGACITALKTSDTISTMDDPSSHTDERNCRADEKSVRRRKLVRSDAISFHNSKEELSNSLNSSHRLSSSNSSFSWEYIYKELAKEEDSNAENTGSIRTSGNHVERVSSNDKSIEVNIQGLSVQENKIPDKKTEELFSGDLGVPGPKTEINSKSSKATSIKHLVPAVSHNADTDQSSDDEGFEFVDHFPETKSLSNIGKSYSAETEDGTDNVITRMHPSSCYTGQAVIHGTDIKTETGNRIYDGIHANSYFPDGIAEGETETNDNTNDVLAERSNNTKPVVLVGGTAQQRLLHGIDMEAETNDTADDALIDASVSFPSDVSVRSHSISDSSSEEKLLSTAHKLEMQFLHQQGSLETYQDTRLNLSSRNRKAQSVNVVDPCESTEEGDDNLSLVFSSSHGSSSWSRLSQFSRSFSESNSFLSSSASSFGLLSELNTEQIEQARSLDDSDYEELLSGVSHNWLLERLEHTGLFSFKHSQKTHNALLLKFSKKSELWTAQETVVYIGDDVDVEKEGKQRKAFWIHFLHQDETLGRYVGKSYKKQKELLYHFCDVERQMTAQHYVTEFNKKLHGLNIPTQIFFVPSAVLLIMEGRSIKECVSVEPYILGEFVKLTNNTRAVKTQYEATKYGLAFGHFVYEYFSDIVVDLQGKLILFFFFKDINMTHNVKNTV